MGATLGGQERAEKTHDVPVCTIACHICYQSDAPTGLHPMLKTAGCEESCVHQGGGRHRGGASWKGGKRRADDRARERRSEREHTEEVRVSRHGAVEGAESESAGERLRAH